MMNPITKKINIFIIYLITLLTLSGCNKDNHNNNFLKDIKCSAFNNIKYNVTNNVTKDTYFITNDNDLYIWNQKDLYENKENCRKINEDDLKIIKQVSATEVLGSDNNVYTLYYHILNKVNKEEKENYDNIVKEYIYILKDDGILYEKLDNGTLEVYKEFTNEKIIDFGYTDELTYIKTDKAYYTKNKDNEFVKNTKLTTLYNDIIYYDGNVTYLTEDGSLYILNN